MDKRKLLTLSFLFQITFLYSQVKFGDVKASTPILNVRDENGKQGKWCMYYAKDSSVYEILHYKNDTLDGYFERYWPDGTISTKGYYSKGELDSLFLGFWEDGKIRAVVNYKQGILNGLEITYDRTGKILTKLNYIDNNQDSTYSESFIDTNIIWDNIRRIKIDTVTYLYTSKWNKKMAIYINDSLNLELDFYKNRLRIESKYKNLELEKRIIYQKKSPYKPEIIYHYENGNVRKEYLILNNSKKSRKKRT